MIPIVESFLSFFFFFRFVFLKALLGVLPDPAPNDKGGDIKVAVEERGVYYTADDKHGGDDCHGIREDQQPMGFGHICLHRGVCQRDDQMWQQTPQPDIL